MLRYVVNAAFGAALFNLELFKAKYFSCDFPQGAVIYGYFAVLAF